MDDNALDALKPAAPAPAAKAARKPAPKTGHTATHPARPTKIVVLPAVPAAPPANPVIPPPPFVMPSHKPPPPPPVPVKADALGTASEADGGLRITFGPASSDLNPATLAALRTLAASLLKDPLRVVQITAYAPGVVDDPSTPRRLSLDRALAARAVLINAGIVSDRIRALARGAADPGGGPADRADIADVAKPAPGRSSTP